MTLHGRFGPQEALVREALRQEGAAWRRTFLDAVEVAAPEPAGRLRGAVAAPRTWFEGERFHGCAFMNTAEHAKDGGGQPWLRELTAEHHAAVLAFLRDLAAMVVSGDPGVLDVAGCSLRAVLADRAA